MAPPGAAGWSAVCNCGISRAHSRTVLLLLFNLYSMFGIWLLNMQTIFLSVFSVTVSPPFTTFVFCSLVFACNFAAYFASNMDQDKAARFEAIWSMSIVFASIIKLQ